MANVNQYKLGYDEFKTNQNHNMEYIKQQHPLWRSGYRKAQQDFSKQNKLVLPSKLYDVPHKTKVFTPTWNDVMAALRRPKYEKLFRQELQPLLFLIVGAVEKRKDTLTSFAQVRNEVDKAFEIVLKYGFDCGILNQKDLDKFNYEPK